MRESVHDKFPIETSFDYRVIVIFLNSMVQLHVQVTDKATSAEMARPVPSSAIRPGRVARQAPLSPHRQPRLRLTHPQPTLCYERQLQRPS
jgi:hypothetical protein